MANNAPTGPSAARPSSMPQRDARRRRGDVIVRLSAASVVVAFSAFEGLAGPAASWITAFAATQLLDDWLWRRRQRHNEAVQTRVLVASQAASSGLFVSLPLYLWFAAPSPAAQIVALMMIMGAMGAVTANATWSPARLWTARAPVLLAALAAPLGSLFWAASPSPAGSLAILASIVIFAAQCAMSHWRAHTGYLATSRARATALEGRRVAERANEAKMGFLRMMSHELRTPVHGVLGMTQLLRETDLDEHQRLCVEGAMTSGERMERVVNDLIDMAEMIDSRVALKNDSVALRALIGEIATRTSARARARGVDFTYQVGTLPEAIAADGARLAQILDNVLDNAVKFAPNLEGASVALLVDARPAGDNHVRLSCRVLDTGPGLTDGALADLFTPFAQANTSTMRAHDGVGLGLPIAHRLTRLMDGSLEVLTEPGLGTCVSFSARFPVTDLHDADAPRRTGATRAVAPQSTTHSDIGPAPMAVARD